MQDWPSGKPSNRGATYSGLALLLCSLWVSGARAEDTYTEAVLDVRVNDTDAGESLVVLRGPDGRVWLSAADLARLRLRPPPVPALQQQGQAWYAPADIAGAAVSVDESKQSARIEAPGDAFQTTRLNAPERNGPSLTRAAPGLFLNYQLSAQEVDGARSTGAFSELGLFGQ